MCLPFLQVVDEGLLQIWICVARHIERDFVEINAFSHLLDQFGLKSDRMSGEWRRDASERMNHEDALRLAPRCADYGQHNQNGHQKAGHPGAANDPVGLVMSKARGSASVLPHHRTLIIRSAHATEAVTGATDGIVLRAWITMKHIHYMRPSSYERCSRSASSQMQCDVDGQDDPFQSSWQSPARCPYPTACSAVGKKLSLYIYMRGQGAGLEFPSFPSKGQAQGRQCGPAFGSPESS